MDNLELFYQKMEDTVIQQASTLINNDLYHSALLSTIPVAYIALDNAGNIKNINTAAKDILNLHHINCIGMPIIQLFESNPDLKDKIERCLKSGGTFHLGMQKLKTLKNEDVIGKIVVKSFMNEEKKIIGVVVSIEDQTYTHYLQAAFKQYVPPSVSELIAQHPQQLELGGEEKVLSILFCDLEGFTHYAEHARPKEVVKTLSEYFTLLTDHVFEFKGTLKEYVGDELMAIFGAPIEQPDHAVLACQTALSMHASLEMLKPEWKKQGKPVLKGKIGINTGSMLVGNIGSIHRFSYGVVGDQVNLASRLEGLNPIYQTKIIIGPLTAAMVQDKFWVRALDLVKVKGKNEQVAIYELIDSKENKIPDNVKYALKQYALGFSDYKKRNFKRAVLNFKKAQSFYPDDYPSQIMADRCRYFQNNPPGDNWDGVFVYKEK